MYNPLITRDSDGRLERTMTVDESISMSENIAPQISAKFTRSLTAEQAGYSRIEHSNTKAADTTFKHKQNIKLNYNKDSHLQTIPQLLWLDLSVCPDHISLATDFKDSFRLTYTSAEHSHTHIASDYLAPQQPDYICLEYDYPDCESLGLLKNIRQQYPSTPIIMYTLQHSEELAVWALRNRVWDYHFLPLSDKSINDISQEMIRCHKKLKAENCPLNDQLLNSCFPNEVRFKHEQSHSSVMDKAINYIQDNYGNKICEQQLSDLCQMSRFQFTRQFKKSVGCTFQNYLLNIRVDKAKQLLKNPKARITDIAYTVGFSDPGYFTRAFKKATGRSPSSFR